MQHTNPTNLTMSCKAVYSEHEYWSLYMILVSFTNVNNNINKLFDALQVNISSLKRFKNKTNNLH